MMFGEKLKNLRIDRKLTQDELAEKIYVTRTAISKWETDRGYPNIESLKAIAKFFSVSLDELLSTDEMLTIAEEEVKQKAKHFRDLIYGLLDLSVALLLFLPFFAEKTEGSIQSVSLITLDSVQPWLKTAYVTVVIVMIMMGALTLALQNCQGAVWLKCKTAASLIPGSISVLLFVISLQPYAAVFSFISLTMKAFVLVKRG